MREAILRRLLKSVGPGAYFEPVLQDLACRSTRFPESALYVFAADHPDAQNAAIEIVYDRPPRYKLGVGFAVTYAVYSMD